MSLKAEGKMQKAETRIRSGVGHLFAFGLVPSAFGPGLFQQPVARGTREHPFGRAAAAAHGGRPGRYPGRSANPEQRGHRRRSRARDLWVLHARLRASTNRDDQLRCGIHRWNAGADSRRLADRRRRGANVALAAHAASGGHALSRASGQTHRAADRVRGGGADPGQDAGRHRSQRAGDDAGAGRRTDCADCAG